VQNGLTYYYFLCLTDAAGDCGAYSAPFIIPDTPRPQLLPDRPTVLGPPTGLPTLSPSTPGSIPFVSIAPSATASSDGAAKTFMTVSIPPSQTVTATPTATAESNGVLVGTSSKGGLAVGAKAGIAVGAVVIVLAILILALLFLRKKHRQRSNQERLMLNQSLNADSRDLITEKEMSPTSYQIPNLNFVSPGSPTSQTRHSALAPYDAIPSQPYNGSAASIPRRKATTSTSTASAVAATTDSSNAVAATIPISREVSSASSHLPPTRAIGTTETASQQQNYEQYHDVPLYGSQATPQVLQGGLQAPFLSETDSERAGSVALTEVDHARLTEEEEERRIDAAIAESERLKNAQGR
jgi:hypothetical protein